MTDDADTRCSWPGEQPDYVAYHDDEWGVPEADDRALFEKLVLDGFQAGLSWLTILRKRDNFRRAFAGFEPERVARFGARDVTRLVADAGIVRHRGKIEGAIANARAFLELQQAEGSYASWLWAFVDGAPLQNAWTAVDQLPAATPLSTQISRELKRRGFSYCGPTIVYAYLQAIGVVNDHVTSCFRHAEVADLRPLLL